MVDGLATKVLQNAAICGPLEGATHLGKVGEPGEGAFTWIWLQLSGERIEKASYRTHGCPSSAAAAGMTVTLVTGRTVSQASLITAEDVKTVLGGLPEGKGHFADMAVEALKKAMETSI